MAKVEVFECDARECDAMVRRDIDGTVEGVQGTLNIQVSYLGRQRVPFFACQPEHVGAAAEEAVLVARVRADLD